jgi:hypothetical protein
MAIGHWVVRSEQQTLSAQSLKSGVKEWPEDFVVAIRRNLTRQAREFHKEVSATSKLRERRYPLLCWFPFAHTSWFEEVIAYNDRFAIVGEPLNEPHTLHKLPWVAGTNQEIEAQAMFPKHACSALCAII